VNVRSSAGLRLARPVQDVHGVTRIEAIIRPSKLEALRAALSGHPWIAGMTVGEVKGFGRSRGHAALFRGAEYTIEFVPKLKVEIVVPDPLVPRIVAELETAMRTGRIGDGKIFTSPVEEAIRVRTGDRGEDAI
jgi:nitrogen regulatory protein P-II 1